jgi:hypothetical protein
MRRAENPPVLFLWLFIITSLIVQFPMPLSAQSTRARSERQGSPVSRDGEITGRVVLDDGKSASNAVIDASLIGAAGFEAHRTECDDQGIFKLMGLKPGIYQISASLPGYVGSRNDSAARLYRIGENVTLSLERGGVITGRITDNTGGPLENVTVNLFQLRDRELRSPSSSLLTMTTRECLTDDRGIYRAFGLPPGVFLVSVTDIPISMFNNGSIPHDIPTYYPSVKREAATEVTVRSGEVVTGIDIRHRGENGHTITGTLSRFSAIGSGPGYNLPVIFLVHEASSEIETATALVASADFSLYGVPDGIYELRAQGISGYLFAAPQRVIMKGADIYGLEPRLLKAGSISGQVIVATSKTGAGCGRQERTLIEEIYLRMRKIEASNRPEEENLIGISANGDFVRSLEEGEYRIIPDLPGDILYVKAITSTTGEAPNKNLDIARDGISVKVGESLTGIGVTVMEGAAILRGRVAVADGVPGDQAPPHSRWEVHLVPAEAAAEDDVLRYAETIARNDGRFELKHLAPGKYFLVARKISEKDLRKFRLTAWDHLERAKLRREAQAQKRQIELGTCQQVTDYLLDISEKVK